MCESERQPLPKSNRQVLEERITDFLSGDNARAADGYACRLINLPVSCAQSILPPTPNDFETRYTYREPAFVTVYNKDASSLFPEATPDGAIIETPFQSQLGLVFNFLTEERDAAVEVSIALPKCGPSTLRIVDYNLPIEEEFQPLGEENGKNYMLEEDDLAEIVGIFDVIKEQEEREEERGEHKMLVDSVGILTDYIVHSVQSEAGVVDEAIERRIPLEYVHDIVAFSTEGLNGTVWNRTAQIFLGTASDDEGNTLRGIKVNAQGSEKDDGYEVITQMVWTNHPEDAPVVSIFEPELHNGEVRELANRYATNEDLRCFKSTLQQIRRDMCNGFDGMTYQNSTESE